MIPSALLAGHNCYHHSFSSGVHELIDLHLSVLSSEKYMHDTKLLYIKVLGTYGLFYCFGKSVHAHESDFYSFSNTLLSGV